MLRAHDMGLICSTSCPITWASIRGPTCGGATCSRTARARPTRVTSTSTGARSSRNCAKGAAADSRRSVRPRSSNAASCSSLRRRCAGAALLRSHAADQSRQRRWCSGTHRSDCADACSATEHADMREFREHPGRACQPAGNERARRSAGSRRASAKRRCRVRGWRRSSRVRRSHPAAHRAP